MKKLKKYLAMFLSALMVMSMFGMAPEKVKAEGEDTTAYLSFSGNNWAVQYWYDGNEYAVTPTNTTVTGYGQYTVGLDLTTSGETVTAIDFIDVEVNNAETLYPGSIMTIDSLKINGEEVAIEKTYTCSDNGEDTRVNIYNAWVDDPSTQGTSPRCADGDLTTAKAVIFDAAAITEYKNIEVTFTISEGDANASTGSAAVEEIVAEPLPEGGTTSYISFADSSWAVQYWFDGNEYPVTANNAMVTGYGQYTVSLDFTTGDLGVAPDITFMDVEIDNGEKYFPNATMTVDSIKVNGEEIEFLPGYTCSDNKEDTRVNIYNSWCSGSPADVDGARVAEGELADTTYTMIDGPSVTEIKTIEVTYTLAEGTAPEQAAGTDASATEAEPLPAEGTTAYLSFADNSWAVQYWFDGNEYPVTANNATVTGYGQYTAGLDFTTTDLGAAPDVAFMDVEVDNGEKYFPNATMTIDSIKVNGEEITYTPGYTCSDNGEDTRVNIYNSWVSQASGAEVDGARVASGELSETTAVMVDVAALTEIKTIEVTFTLAEGQAADTTEPETEEPAESAIKEEGYTAFVMFMSQSETWSHMASGTPSDVIVKGDGMFEIVLPVGEAGPDGAAASSAADGAKVFCIDIEGFGAAMKEVGVQTDNIDKDKNKLDSDVKVDVDVYVDGSKIKLDDAKLLYGDLEDKGNFRIEIYNEWGSGTKDNSPLLFDKVTPASELKVVFTLEGTGFVDEEHPVVTPEPTAATAPTTAPADDNTSDAADAEQTSSDSEEGGMNPVVIVVIVVVVIAVVAGVVVASKKKGNK